MNKFSWIKNLKPVTDKLGKNWRFVGGCVRDSLLNIITKDIDIVTIKTPDEILKLMKGFHLNEIGKRFGTIGVFYKEWTIEITTVREDVEHFGRKANVSFLKKKNAFYIDSSRRDFTINALSYNGKRIYDYHNGIKDLKNKKVRFVGNPLARIQEDYLRIFRYIRFFIRFGKRVSYIKLFKENLEGLKYVSMERIINEIEKMAVYEKFSKAINLLNKIGISIKIFQENLNDKINKNLNTVEKIAIVFKNFSLEKLNKLSINKDSRKLLEMDFISDRFLKYNNIFNNLTVKERCFLNAAVLWCNSKDNGIKYLKFAEYKYKIKFNVLKQSWPDKFLENNIYSGKERGIKEVMSRFFFLKNKK